MDGQGTKRRRNIAENFNRLSRVHQRYRRQTDGRPMTYSEHELEFTFANKIECQLRDVHRHNVQLVQRRSFTFKIGKVRPGEGLNNLRPPDTEAYV